MRVGNVGRHAAPCPQSRALLDHGSVFQVFFEAVGLQLALVHAVVVRLSSAAPSYVAFPAVRGPAATFVVSCSSFCWHVDVWVCKTKAQAARRRRDIHCVSHLGQLCVAGCPVP